MSKLFIFFGFFVFFAIIMIAEFFLNPLKVYETRETEKLNEKTLSPLTSLPALPNLSFSTDIQAAKLENVKEEEGAEVTHLFYQAEFSVFSNQFRVFRIPLVQEKDGNKENYANIYEIFSTKKRTISGAYNEVKAILEKSLEGNVEGKITEMEGVHVLGQKSFILKVAPDQTTVYIVVAYRDRLLGFEYPNLRHEEMKRLFLQLFSQ